MPLTNLFCFQMAQSNQSLDDYVNSIIGHILNTKTPQGEHDIKKIVEVVHMAHELDKKRMREEFEKKLKEAREANNNQNWHNNRPYNPHYDNRIRQQGGWSTRPPQRGGFRPYRGHNNYRDRSDTPRSLPDEAEPAQTQQQVTYDEDN